MTTDTQVAGLSSAEVAERLARGQVNVLPPRSGRTTWDIIRANVFTRINAILTVLLLLVMTTGSWINCAFGLVIIANSGIGMIQEMRAKRTLDSLAIVGEMHPTVIRDGIRSTISREEVVLDDIIEIGPGDQMVVDGEVTSADYLEIDESLLTGEAEPVPKAEGDEVMSGSHVVSGTGTYRATKVGADSYATQLAAAASKFTLAHSELRYGINQVLKLITWLLIPVGILTIWVQLTRPNTTWQQAILRMTGALVPMVPEGLILLTSVAFAVGVVRLGRRKCLVQEMPAIEGLARVDVVCADKTGTLTENKMTLGEIRCLNDHSEREVHDLLGQFISADQRPNASLQALSEGIAAPKSPWSVSARAPFTSAKKWSGASFAEHGNWVLGAPDVLGTGLIADQAEEIGATGRRVLLFGQVFVPVDSPDAPGDVHPVALIVLDQVIRPDAQPTLEYFADQNVTVKIISGDNASSVGAVARSLGVRSAEPVDARNLPSAPEAFATEVEKHTVFGRVTPDQKRQMVAALQSRNHTVAMTGDGVNDVLALKDADLGVAMGSGSPAAQAVAQIVLLDDRFATLPHVVSEGRRVLGNIERVAKLFLTKTVYSALLALIIGLTRLPFPYRPIHVTITGWFTIGIPAFFLSLAPNNERARPGFLRRVISFSIPAGVITALVSFATYRIVLPSANPESHIVTQCSTATLAAMILTATWVLAIVARPYRWWRVGLIAVSFLSYAVIFALPWTRKLFLLDISDQYMMTVGICAGLVGIVLVEILWWVVLLANGERPRVWRRTTKAAHKPS